MVPSASLLTIGIDDSTLPCRNVIITEAVLLSVMDYTVVVVAAK